MGAAEDGFRPVLSLWQGREIIMSHLHVGALDALVVFAYLLIFGFLWRTAAAKLADRPLGQAMAFIY